MGVWIHSVKPIQKLATIEEAEKDNYKLYSELEKKYDSIRCIWNYTGDDYHNLTTIEEGLYEVEDGNESNCDMGYSSYNYLRNVISEIVIGVSDSAVWMNPTEYEDNGAFYLVNFSDCEGCFDYIIAERILNAIKPCVDEVRKELEDNKFYLSRFDALIRVLEECVENKGVVIFS